MYGTIVFISIQEHCKLVNLFRISTEAATGGVKKVVLKNFRKFTGKQLCQSLFSLAQMFSCEFCEIFYRTPLDDCFCINIFKTTVFIGITKGRISYFMVFSIPEAATGGVL